MAAYYVWIAKIRGWRSGRTAGNGDCEKITLPFAYRFKNCGAFGTICGSIGGIFDIASAKKLCRLNKARLLLHQNVNREYMQAPLRQGLF